MKIILDTHVLVWLCEGNERLGKKALKLINQASTSEQLAVATISFWEIAMLVEKGRLKMLMKVADFRRKLLTDGLLELPLSGSAAIIAAAFTGFHGDPADRIVVATALEEGAVVVTADQKILSWAGLKDKVDATK